MIKWNPKNSTKMQLKNIQVDAWNFFNNLKYFVVKFASEITDNNEQSLSIIWGSDA